MTSTAYSKDTASQAILLSRDTTSTEAVVEDTMEAR